MKGIKPYKKDFDYSYTSGAYVIIELLKTRPSLLKTVYINSAFNQPDGIEKLCAENGVVCTCNDAVFRRINQKENTYVLGIFKKYSSEIKRNEPHIVLVNPGDMGNLGTIIRTLTGFNVRNLAIITPAADIWNPKTIRASMGGVFQINFQYFETIDKYLALFPQHQIFPLCWMANWKQDRARFQRGSVFHLFSVTRQPDLARVIGILAQASKYLNQRWSIR